MEPERITFFVNAVLPDARGWSVQGEPGFEPAFWARRGDRFVAAVSERNGDERAVALVVEELTASHLIVSGSGGEAIRPGDILAGVRQVEL